MTLLIRNGCVVTMNAAREIFEGGHVIVGDDGRIAGVGPASACPALPEAVEIDARGMLVLPGLVDADHHAWQNLFMAGAGRGLPALAAARAQGARLGEEALEASARVAAHTLLRGGVTTVLNHAPAGAAEAATRAAFGAFAAAGLRQVQAVAFDTQASLEDESRRLQACIARWHGADDGRARVAVDIATSVVATERGSAREAATAEARRLAVAHDLRLVTRGAAADAQDSAEHESALRRHGRSEVMHLMELGALDERWLLVGAEWLTPTDVALMRESGCAAVYSPLTEAARGFGSGPWPELRRAGVRCALGTGAMAMHAGGDMVEQMKASILIQNTVRLDATALGAEAALEMATIDAARALGLDHEIGSLEAGKRADIAVFDMRGVQMQVAHKPISVFVTNAGASDAAWVIVDGRVLVRQGVVAQRADATPWLEAARRHAFAAAATAWN